MSILNQIIQAKLVEVEQSRRQYPQDQLERLTANAPPVRDFLAAVRGAPPIRLIAEIKRASPSRGVIRADFDAAGIARIYQDRGAACISVLTDAAFFHGSLEHLRMVRREVELPLLRKDFILDEYQVIEARAAGADAVLLIAECLEPAQLKRLHDCIVRHNMTPLVELFDPASVPAVCQCRPKLVGINNRDLRTFDVNLRHTLSMRRQLPSDCLVVAESGILNRADVLMLQQAGIDAILVGEALMAEQDIGAAVDRLLGHTR